MFNAEGLTIRQTFSKLFDRAEEIWEDIKQGTIFGGKGALEAVNNAPVYAKLPLMHAGGIVGVGVYSGGVLVTNYVLANPVEVQTAGITIIETLDGYYGGSSPGYNAGSFTAGLENVTGINIIPEWLKP